MIIPILENNEPLEVLSSTEFVCEPVYFVGGHTTDSTIRLRRSVVEKLRQAQALLQTRGGYRLKIFDGFRPLSLQEKMYNDTYAKFQKENPTLNPEELQKMTHVYWAYPEKDPLAPPPHNTGGAVDLTLVDSAGQEVFMGTAFDELSKKSHTDFFVSSEGSDEPLASEYHARRALLRDVLESVGFKNYPEEWWHYNSGNQEWAEYAGVGEAVYGSAE